MWGAEYAIVFTVAGGQGFEPRQAESESAVLPLDDPPNRNRCHKIESQTSYVKLNSGVYPYQVIISPA